MRFMKKLLTCTLVVAMIGSATAFVSTPADETAIAEKALSEVAALYQDHYTISNAEAETLHTTYDDAGNTIVNMVVSFNRTLKATCAEDMPYIMGLESAIAELSNPVEIRAARAYIDARKADLESNYIGVPQDTYIEIQVTVPTPTNRSNAAQAIDIGNIEYVGMDKNIPAEELAPDSVSDKIESGRNDLLAIAANASIPMSRATYINDKIINYDRVKARDYARNWSCTKGLLSAHSSCHNLSYKFEDSNDCTNFVSQCFVAGGLEPDDVWYAYSDPWMTTGNNGNGIRQYVTDNGLFFHSTDENKAFAGSIINWLNSDGTNAGHVGIVDQNDTETMTFCAHTRCRRSCPWEGELVDFYIPYWDSYNGVWTQ